MTGTGFGTFAAASTLHRVYGGVEVLHLHCASFADLYALHAADAAHLAYLGGSSALVAVGAANHSLLFQRHKADEPLGASRHTLAAALTFFWVDAGHTVANGNGVILTGFHTVAQTHAAETAGSNAASQLGGSGAADNAVVFHLVGGVVIAAHAVNQRGFVLHFHIAGAQQLGNGFCGFGTAGRTQTGLGFAFGEGSSIAATPE